MNSLRIQSKHDKDDVGRQKTDNDNSGMSEGATSKQSPLLPDADTLAAASNDEVVEKVIQEDPSFYLTYLRQSLESMQSEYFPQCCNQCWTNLPSHMLKTCGRCKIARYCSKECQALSWKFKHKSQCKAMETATKSKLALESYIPPGEQQKPRASLDGRPWIHEDVVDYIRMFFYKKKLILSGVFRELKSSILTVFDTSTGFKEGTVRPFEKTNLLVGDCSAILGDKPYVVLAVMNFARPADSLVLEYWSYPSCEPDISAALNPFSMNGFCYFEGYLLIANPLENLIDEFDLRSSAIEATGLQFPIDEAGCGYMHKMCVFRRGDQKKVILLYTGGKDNDIIIKCMDYMGHELWKLNSEKLQEMKLHPRDVCTDNKGRIFLTNARRNSVVTLNEDLSITTIIFTPGSVYSAVWNEDTDHLYVTHYDSKDKRMMTSRYNFSED